MAVISPLHLLLQSQQHKLTFVCLKSVCQEILYTFSHFQMPKDGPNRFRYFNVDLITRRTCTIDKKTGPTSKCFCLKIVKCLPGSWWEGGRLKSFNAAAHNLLVTTPLRDSTTLPQGLRIIHPAYQIFILQFITVAKLRLSSSNKYNITAGVTTT